MARNPNSTFSLRVDIFVAIDDNKGSAMFYDLRVKGKIYLKDHLLAHDVNSYYICMNGIHI